MATIITSEESKESDWPGAERVSQWRVRSQATSTSTLADVLDGMGIAGVISPGVRRLSGAAGVAAGLAYCVRWAMVRKTADITEPQPSTWQQVGRFLVPEIEDGSGLVYVAGTGPLTTDAALAGGLSATYFNQIGFDSIVLGGAMRDPAMVADLDLPISATGFVPSDTQGAYRVVDTGSWTAIDHVIVNTRDWVVSDEAGSVVVPKDRVDEVLDRAERIDGVERDMLRRVQAGARLPDLVAEQGRI